MINKKFGKLNNKYYFVVMLLTFSLLFSSLAIIYLKKITQLKLNIENPHPKFYVTIKVLRSSIEQGGVVLLKVKVTTIGNSTQSLDGKITHTIEKNGRVIKKETYPLTVSKVKEYEIEITTPKNIKSGKYRLNTVFACRHRNASDVGYFKVKKSKNLNGAKEWIENYVGRFLETTLMAASSYFGELYEYITGQAPNKLAYKDKVKKQELKTKEKKQKLDEKLKKKKSKPKKNKKDKKPKKNRSDLLYKLLTILGVVLIVSPFIVWKLLVQKNRKS